jgi:hypothetical protein
VIVIFGLAAGGYSLSLDVMRQIALSAWLSFCGVAPSRLRGRAYLVAAFVFLFFLLLLLFLMVALLK